ncbi:MAG: isoleucine--tRNA ligase [Anaerolineales bacterium]|jgi:isoleucyl-tRNA synthetase
MFKPVSTTFNPGQFEESVLRFWKAGEIFTKSRQQRQGGSEYVFYEKPPTANHKPAAQHVLAWVFKDLFLRYKTLRGYHVIRRSGWDTHGMPVEVEVEKQLGITHKWQIEEYGLERFNELCRKSVFAYIQDWEKLTDRIAFWVDMQDAYVTYTNDYIESLWWMLKQFWEGGLLQQRTRVVPYCPRCGTPLSEQEAIQNTRLIEDPSIYVRLPLVDEPGTSLLVWTTTPWTLPANVAVAAHPEDEYVTVENRGSSVGTGEQTERLILRRANLKDVFGTEELEIVDAFNGKKLKGKRYHPLFTFILPAKEAHRVVLGDYPGTKEGTGLAHIAPAFRDADFQIAVEHDLPVLLTVAEDGTFNDEIGPWRGVFVKDADPRVIQDLDARGLLFKAGVHTHKTPFCWCCDSPLLDHTCDAWYLRTTAYMDRLMALNDQVNWYPAGIEEDRYAAWLRSDADWAISRQRYWGTPLPIWECPACHHQICIGSLEELQALAGMDLTDLDLHRPYVDRITVPCETCGAQMKRVPELIDVGFDSGAIATAQWHYPFENQETFETQYPADFICEVFEQNQGWLFAVHALSAPLFERPSFQNVIRLGDIVGEQDQRTSLSNGNLIDPWDVLDAHGADALRWYLYTAGPPEQDRRISTELVGRVITQFVQTLWNVYAFFVTHANLVGWEPPPPTPAKSGKRLEAPGGLQDQVLDRWLLAELHTLIRDVTTAYETYDVLRATRPIQSFVEKLSHWYLRHSRQRYRISAADPDIESAYTSLYRTLVALSKLLAPAAPFTAEALYQNLVASADPQAPQSVHLCDWPIFDPDLIDQNLIIEMDLVMELASLGHAARDKAGIKMRQPLSEAAFVVGNAQEAGVVEVHADLLKEELNVKRVSILQSVRQAFRYILRPIPGELGSKYKDRYPLVRDAILGLDQQAAAHKLLDGEPIEVLVRSKFLEISPQEVQVIAKDRDGLSTAAAEPYLAALSTRLTPELEQEGLVGEFIEQVKRFRKQADLEVTDRIQVHYLASPQLAAAIEAHRQSIIAQTLAVELKAAEPVEDMFVGEARFSEQELRVGLIKMAL